VKHTSHSTSRKGDVAEYYAVTWLWDNGYEVFVNAGCSGPIDMIAIKDKETLLIDVKTLYTRPERPESSLIKGTGLRSSGKKTELQKKLGVIFLAFNPVTRELKYLEHKDEESN
jgi:hypothetical protein